MTSAAGADRISDTRAAMRMGRDQLAHLTRCFDNHPQLVKRLDPPPAPTSLEPKFRRRVG